MSNFGEGDTLVVNGLRYYQGGTVLGDLIITGDLEVEGGGSFTFDEIVNGSLEIAGGPFVLALTDGTEQSRFTQASGSTTWAAASASTIRITPGGPADIVLGAAADTGLGQVVIGPSATGYRITVGQTAGIEMRGASAVRYLLITNQVQIRSAAPLVLFSDDGTTEQSRFTPAAGSTTWAGATNSNILITHASNAGIVIGNAAATDNEIRIGNASMNTGIGVEFTTPSAYINVGTTRNMNFLTASTGFWNAKPLIFYSDTGTTEQSRITPTAGVTTWLASLATDIIIDTATGALVVGSATLGADGSARLTSPDGTDYYEAINGTLTISTNSVSRLILSDTLVAISNATPFLFYSGDGVTEQARFTVAAGSVVWEAGAAGGDLIIRSDDDTDFILVESGNIEINMASVEVHKWADTYETHRMMADGVASDSFFLAFDAVVTNAQTVTADDTVRWASGGTVQSAAAADTDPLGVALTTGTGDPTGTVKVSVQVLGYRAVLTADVGGVTFGAPLKPGANVANRWIDAVAGDNYCAIALATQTDGLTFPAWFCGGTHRV